ncbi:MAG TPA: hypothetical protein VKA94_16260 [Hyphomicrobiales bacterium]|nr:hypothetical protein [Hyphomicrobiales bacterium]
MFELRRAIQRRQWQLENDNQLIAAELMEMLDINRAVLNNLLLLMSEADVDIENQAEFLAESLASYRILARDLYQLNAGDKQGHDFAEIAAEILKGEWTAASKLALVMETRALAEKQQEHSEKQQEEEGQPARSERAAIAEYILGQIALVRANYSAAARHFAAAAEYSGETTPEGQTFNEAAADALYADTKSHWNERSLQEAVDIYRRVLDNRPRNSSPELWAQTQNKLGNAILRLGVGTNSIPLITGAVSAFEAALEVQTPAADPKAWPANKADLADALVQLGNRLNEQKDLHDAIDAYQGVLAWVRFEDDPGFWVELQTSLGNALWSLGRQETGPDALSEAIAVFQEALNRIDRERQLRDWGAAQNNIGAAYFLLAERVEPVKNAKNAVAAFEASLSAYREASAVYFITGVRKNLAGAQALLQQSLEQQPPERTPAGASSRNTSSTPIR